MIQSQGLQLRLIDKNPGLLPVREGQAFVSYDKWTVIKILDLKLVYEELELNINRFVTLRNQVHSCIDNKVLVSDLIDAEVQTDYIMNITVDKYKQLIPSSKVKRGLVNPLGSLIKIITGNLDNDDALLYEKSINSLKSKQDSLFKKMTIVTEMVGTFTNIANSTRSNFIQIEESIREIDLFLNESKTHENLNKIIHNYGALMQNFQILYLRLSEIETAVAFSKIKVLHQSVVDTDELLLLLREIENYGKLLYPANLENLIKIEECIEMKAYIKQNQIKFILHIPLVRDEIYNYYKLIPLPIFDNVKGQTTLILPKYPYVLVKGLKTVPLSQPCSEADEDHFLCYENDAAPSDKDDCVAELLQFATNVSSCHPIPVTINDVKVDPIQPNRWIIYANIETTLTKFCENEITQETVRGTYLLTMNDECVVKIKGITLKRHQINGKDIIYEKLPIIQLPKISNLSKQRKPVNLNGINLADVQFLNYLLQKDGSEMFSDSENSDNGKYESVLKSVSIGNIVIWLIIALIFVTLAIKYTVRKAYCVRKTRDDPSDNLELREEGVMHPGTIVISG